MTGAGSLSETLVGWHQVQESLSRLTGLEFAVYDSMGMPLGLVSGESPFCRAAKRKGQDGSSCDRQCGGFIRSASAGREASYYKCGLGQNVFALSIRQEGMQDIVIAGGKTFSNRQEYEAALAGSGFVAGRLSPSGKHRYRFVGRKKLRETVDLVRTAAVHFFDTSRQKQKYQLRHNRQTALIENISLLYHEGDMDGFIRGMLRNVAALFESEGAALVLFGRDGEGRPAVFVHGQGEGGLAPQVERAADELAARHARSPEIFRTDRRDEVAGLGLGAGVRSFVSVPFYGQGSPEGAVCLVNPGVGVDEMPSLRAYVQQCASIIENKSLRREMGEKMRGLRELIEVSSKIGPLMDTEDVLGFMFDKSAEIIQAERGSLMVLNEKTEELVVKVSRGLGKELGAGFRLKLGECIAGGVVTSGAPLVVRDMESDHRLLIKKRPRYKTKSFISFPLKAEGRVIGVLNLSDKISGGTFGEDDLDVLSTFASQTEVALERAIYYGKAEELRKASVMDPVTGLLNQRYFSDRLFEEIDRSERYGRRFSLMTLKLAGLKDYEAVHGRSAADDAIVEVSRTLREMLRSNDIMARYCEEGFAVALPETDKEKAALLAGRIKDRVASLGFLGGESGEEVTANLGLASYPDDGLDPKTLFEKASMR